MHERLLVVEDDEAVAQAVLTGLEQAGFRVSCERDGAGATSRLHTDTFDLVVLDLMLPDMDGFDVCREIRRSSLVPILMLTARAEPTYVVAGLELGADDYVIKPFELSELIARVRAVLRRSEAPPDATAVEVGPLRLDPATLSASKGGKRIRLTATQFRLLYELARHPNQVLTRQELLERVWQQSYLGDSRLVDTAVKRLRAKVEDPAAEPLIESVRGAGYRLRSWD